MQSADLEIDVTQPDQDSYPENEKFGYGQVVEVTLLETGKKREYMICEALGEGGYSSVHLANDLSNEEMFVAVKCIDLTSPKVIRLGKQAEFEVEVLQRLQHSEFVIELIAVKLIPRQTLYMFMELALDSLHKIFYDKRADKVPISTSYIASYWVPILRSVSFIHQNDIVHCDLKPDNFVTMEGPGIRVKLIDFGCAARLSPLTEAVVRRKTLGTTRYMAPEYLRYRMISKESDVWALGVLLFWMMVGTTPFKGTRKEARVAILNKDIDLSEITDKDVLFSLKMILQKDRENRPSCNKLLRISLCSPPNGNSTNTNTDREKSSSTPNDTSGVQK
ncbi:unnamed protein product [Bursaphelenchus xylophilus]|uniref:(pine wood nematode) hypothetical protein n=1 Tax=Bursaphelenchus xylophilus TaxID=6326 RepID=A0A1I7RI19_BURXY|nr:unnamed protein product [Bursaphelenchus xylophilus]CAG9115217.1 unnamed protein product [Bursaphelenchus xylophilus]